MGQSTMLLFNKTLMAIASVSAVRVLRHVNPFIVVVSVVLNFNNRGHDLINVIITAALATIVSDYIKKTTFAT